MHASIRSRTTAFCQRYGLAAPLLLAPMAGACPPSLSIAVGAAGGMGACGALLLQPDEIRAWGAAVRAGTTGPFQMNLWIPGAPPTRDAAHEAALRAFLAHWGPEVAADAPERAAAGAPDFAAQCAALLDCAPAAISSIMGLYPPDYVAALKARGSAWWATATTVAEARAAAAAGADAIIAQGMEAGGHRGSFDPAVAEVAQVGTMALVPAIVDAVSVPVIATGGIADGRGAAAALLLGASAVQIGTGFLRCPEARLAPAWAAGLGRAAPEDTLLTRAFSGRAGRALTTAYARAASAADAPRPAPYPVQRALTAGLRGAAVQRDDLQAMQAWAGQAAALAPEQPAGTVLRAIWDSAQQLLD